MPPQLYVVTATFKNLLTIGTLIFDLFLFFYLIPFVISIGFFIGRRIICVPDCVRSFVNGIRRIPSRLYILLWRASECVSTSWHLLGVKRIFIIVVWLLRRLSFTARQLLYRLSLTMYAQCNLALTIPLYNMTFSDHHKQSVALLFRNKLIF
jgi:hypothetical protein